MTARPRSKSIVQAEPAAESKLTQDESNVKKRRLSGATDALETRKKSRAASEDASAGGDDKPGDSTDAASNEDDEDDEEPVPPELAAPGPHAFYMCVEAIWSVVDEAVSSQDVVLKSTALEAYRKVADLPKEEQFDAVGKHIQAVKSWTVSDVDEQARETPSAKAMLKKWNEIIMKAIQREKRGTKSDQWWYEVTLQRERPQEGAPGVEITLCSHDDDDDGFWRWFFVDVKAADEEGEAAMELVGQFISERDY
ncbi:hypothetical protein PsYK624_065140 [Phanerochaete sordida]|uniref:Uncharacterized protein n=1 Tax=Phanerochaete sordida TaxID=48140 RepID=A0A9P3G8R7_9APHY|nr:hypothetical protein PsYK624_065140 [Phanerochaete sordida]